MKNEMCLISLRDIISDNFYYEYRGKIPNQCLPAYKYVVQQLGLDIDFTGTVVKDCQQVHISHCCKTDIEFEMFGYRRIQVREYIKSHYNNYVIASDDIVKPKYIIISDPRKAVIELIEKIAFGDEVVMIYDKTDKWESINGFADKLDKLCLEYADIITYSAKGLEPKQYQDKAYYVPNGNKIYDIPEVEKYTTPTAIYAGNNLDKFNGQVLYMLAELYPEWNFIVYISYNRENSKQLLNCPPNVEFRTPIPQEELILEMAKCHVGLLLFYNKEWESGMLPLKFFNYINVGIPALYTSILSKNLEDYNEVAFSLDTTLDELLEVEADYKKYYRDWGKVIEELTQVWRIADET